MLETVGLVTKRHIFKGEEYPDLSFNKNVVEHNGRVLRYLMGSSKAFEEIGGDPAIINRTISNRPFLAYQGASFVPTPAAALIANEAAAVTLEKLTEKDQATVIDIGTGTAVLPIIIADRLNETGCLENTRIVATDISGAALTVAEINLKINGFDRVVELRERDCLDGIRSEFGPPDIIVSNPPYYNGRRMTGSRFEPELALDGGGPDGLDFSRRLLGEAPETLTPDGSVVLQVQEINADEVLNIARQSGFTGEPRWLRGRSGKRCGLTLSL